MLVESDRIYVITYKQKDDLSEAIIAGRQQIQDGVRVMAEYVPELRGVKLVSTAAQLGVRETRHIAGRYRLEEADLRSGRRFDDGICVVRFVIDVHGVKPMAGTQTIEVRGEKVPPYHIPYRALLPVNRENLLMAGRCISGTSRAHASFRVTGDCLAMGQAAGTAAALSLQQGVAPSALDPSVLVQRLKADGVRL